MHVLQALLVAVFPALVIVAALRDATSYTIPNWISAALIAGFALAAPAMGLTLPQIGLHLGVGVVGLILGMAMWTLGWIGGGDAKLFAAASLWLGWPAALTYAALTGMAGGALAVGLLTLRSGYVRPYVVTGPSWFARLAEPGENVPYGVAIAAGALMAFPATPFMAALRAF
ncbi:A24 family peptidase [Phenylobacterium soli]|uniref:Pilus assembly protein CpaA n=1 Tax=Phenylobacterium soli TaxID=2170551 RepID=A0A328AMM4_9CAUL|nr:prepilin peptidase [Phenylobacterium soli]RAK56233.1 pilus assembly protein CpaA [Phenylobacterium soli]